MNKSFQQNAGRGCVKQKLSASLAEDFGLELFKKKAGSHAERILAELGTYSRGKRKGKQKGFIHWVKVVEGGFDYYGSRTVVYRGSSDYRVAKEFGYTHEDCEFVLNFDHQHNVLVDALKGLQEKHDELDAETSKAKGLLDRYTAEENAEKRSADSFGDVYVTITKELIESNTAKLQKLQERITFTVAQIDALDKGLNPALLVPDAQ
ncbi:hypothetical protein OTK49_21050 [Vibrio coralliirubri]|uniref:hypothetical protein n=1 Tax=Vibrio coralliirubri TaxID=1516159 RepID=UPI0022853087|nr:hypothetical protein [Vibrio coralliirubri]MCY9865008.1 hypothetical protein [Vibrio coralliirubri]